VSLQKRSQFQDLFYFRVVVDFIFFSLQLNILLRLSSQNKNRENKKKVLSAVEKKNNKLKARSK